MQRTGANRFAHRQMQRHRRLAPAADLLRQANESPLMKKCSHCGKVYGDDVETCPSDGRPLVVVGMSPAVRTRLVALLKLGGGVLVAFILFRIVRAWDLPPRYHAETVAIAPLVVALVGMLEVTTGLSILELGGRWESLPGWQRCLLGLLVIAGIVGAILFYVFVIM